MKLLIAGGEGQLGREFTDLVLSADVAVQACGRSELDITDINSVRRAVERYRPDVIVNAAAYTAVDRAETEAAQAHAINAQGVANLAIVAQENGLALIQVSTDYVFDGSKPAGQAYRPDDACNPRTAYGRSKLAGEQLAMQHCARTIILRTSWVFGRYGHNFPKTMLRLGAERDHLRIVSDQYGCPTHAADIAETIVHVAQAAIDGRLPAGIYHYAGAPVCTWHGFALAVLEAGVAAGLLARMPGVEPIATHEYPLPAPRPANSALDCSDLLRHVPAVQCSDWHRGIGVLIAALQQPGVSA